MSKCSTCNILHTFQGWTFFFSFKWRQRHFCQYLQVRKDKQALWRTRLTRTMQAVEVPRQASTAFGVLCNKCPQGGDIWSALSRLCTGTRFLREGDIKVGLEKWDKSLTTEHRGKGSERDKISSDLFILSLTISELTRRLQMQMTKTFSSYGIVNLPTF